MPIPTFEEAWPGYDASGYAATNEEPELFRRMMKGKRFKRVATIASAGELPYLVMLPIAKEVVAIDHSYRSICVCFIKAHMLDLMGAKKMKDFLVEASYDQFCDFVLSHVKPLMPEALQKKLFLPMPLPKNTPTFHLRYKPEATRWGQKPRKQFLPSNYYGHQSYGHGNATVAATEWNEVRREWQNISIQRMEYIRKNLHRVKFVHGDVKDLVKEGKGTFDALYISNALNHGSRDPYPLGSKTKFGHWFPLLKKGGFVLSTNSTGLIQMHKGFKHIRSIPGIRSHWLHEVFRFLPGKEATA